MKSMLSMAILTIFLSACLATQPEKTSEVPKYGILPFETENMTPETAKLIPDAYSKTLASTVRGTIEKSADPKELTVELLSREQPISRTDVEMPVASFDDEYKNTLDADLLAMSADYDGLIFGHLEEEFAGDGSLLLIMRVYRKEDGHIESFEGDAIDLGDVTTKRQMKKELGDRIIQLSEEVKMYIVEPPESVGSYGDVHEEEDNDAADDNEDNDAPEDDEEKDFFSIAEELPPKLEGEVLPGEELKPTDRTKHAITTSMSLKDVYKMLYKRGFYVTVPFHDKKHIRARQAAARELRINKWTFRDSFKKVKRKSIEIPTKKCYEKHVYRWYQVGATSKYKYYNLCYDVRYLYSESEFVPKKKLNLANCESLPRGRKTSMLTYSEAEDKIDRLRQKTGNQRWKIPSIDELYVLTDGHLPYSWQENAPNVIWSSTSLPHKPYRKWVIQAYLEKQLSMTGYKYYYSPKLWDSSNLLGKYSNLNLRGAYTDTAILFPVYPCGPNN